MSARARQAWIPASRALAGSGARHPSKRFKFAPLDAGYQPARVEAGLYQWWVDNQLFEPETTTSRQCQWRHRQGLRSGSAQPEVEVPTEPGQFTMMLPPPNVTGALHLGHALTVTIQDTLARWHRMRGGRVLWLPGTDHAGIATQTVVERWVSRRRRFPLDGDATVWRHTSRRPNVSYDAPLRAPFRGHVPTIIAEYT